jgi:hypothetical protein
LGIHQPSGNSLVFFACFVQHIEKAWNSNSKWARLRVPRKPAGIRSAIWNISWNHTLNYPTRDEKNHQYGWSAFIRYEKACHRPTFSEIDRSNRL